MKITSLDNKKIKYLMKLKNKKFRDQENKFNYRDTKLDR